MTADDEARPGFSLRRWSQRKHEAKRAATAVPAEPPPIPSAAATPASPGSASPAAPAPALGAASVPASAPAEALPPVDTLSFESDFAPFVQPKVDEALKRQALKKLFGDPRFNVMDGLDVYIDDYSTPDPLPPGMLEQLVQGRYLFDPPKTRVNEHGVVEDVPPGEVDAARAPADAAAPAPAAAGGGADAAADVPATAPVPTAPGVAPADPVPPEAEARDGVPADAAPGRVSAASAPRSSVDPGPR